MLPPHIFDSIDVGDPLAVTYWPERPSEFVAIDRDAAYTTMSVFLFAIAPLLLFLGLLLGLRVNYLNGGMVYRLDNMLDRLVRRLRSTSGSNR